MAQTKIPTILTLPLPPNTSDKADMERYIRQLHKVLDEWYRVNRQDTAYSVEGTHGHENKSILDDITVAFTIALAAAYDGAVAVKHSHSNKTTLDAIQEALTTVLKAAYDDAVSKAHEAASVQNVGTGAGLVYKTIDGQLISLRTIKAGTNVSVVNNTNDIEISASAGAGGGDVTGPAGAVNGNIVLFDGVTGKIIKDSGIAIGNLAIQFVDDVEDLPEGPNVDDVYWIRNDKNLARYNGADWDYITEERFTSVLKTAYDAAVTASHSHSNKTQLDAISDLASQAEAEAGTDNTKWMSPLRTQQALTALGGNVGALMIVVDEKSAGTNGGTFTSGAWRTRTLNTVRYNGISGASLASNRITLPAGTYELEARAACYWNTVFSCEHKTRFQQISPSGVTIITGDPGSENMYEMGMSAISHVFTITQTSIFELQHQISDTVASMGLGKAAGFSAVETYAVVKLRKIA